MVSSTYIDRKIYIVIKLCLDNLYLVDILLLLQSSSLRGLDVFCWLGSRLCLLDIGRLRERGRLGRLEVGKDRKEELLLVNKVKFQLVAGNG